MRLIARGMQFHPQMTEPTSNPHELVSKVRVPRTLLLTFTLPGHGGVGELYLRDLCLSYPIESLSCFAVLDGARQLPPDLKGMPFESVDGVPSFSYRPWPGRIGTLTSLASFLFHRNIRAKHFVRRIADFARRQQVKMIWAILESPILYRVADLARRKLGIPMVCTVWDPPSSVCRLRGLDSFSRKIARRDFATAVAGCERCGVTSENMGEEYRRRFNVPTVVMQYASPLEEVLPTRQGFLRDDEVVFGFCGSLYASQEWDALLEALNSVDWTIGRRKVKIRVVGRKLQVRSADRARIEFFGWRSPDEMSRFLGKVDIGYLPYWFGPTFREAVRLCFPTKLGSYLAAGIPVFFHGPPDSSPAEFLASYPAGVCCHTLEPAGIVASLEQICSDQDAYQAMTRQGRRSIEEALNQDLFRKQFRTLIGDVKGT